MVTVKHPLDRPTLRSRSVATRAPLGRQLGSARSPLGPRLVTNWAPLGHCSVTAQSPLESPPRPRLVTAALLLHRYVTHRLSSVQSRTERVSLGHRCSAPSRSVTVQVTLAVTARAQLAVTAWASLGHTSDPSWAPLGHSSGSVRWTLGPHRPPLGHSVTASPLRHRSVTYRSSSTRSLGFRFPLGHRSVIAI